MKSQKRRNRGALSGRAARPWFTRSHRMSPLYTRVGKETSKIGPEISSTCVDWVFIVLSLPGSRTHSVDT